jgi:Retroviral aspartyl protease
MIKAGAVHTESVFPLATRNYKIYATVGVTIVISTPLRVILDTGAGPSLIRKEVLPDYWSQYRVTDAPLYNVVGAGGKRLRQKGVITLFVQVGNLRTQARFIVVHSVAAECIRGWQFIDRHVRSILPKEKRVLLSDDSVIPILQDSEIFPDIRKRGTPKKPILASTKIKVAKFTILPPRSEATIWVQCAAPGLRFLQALNKRNALGVYMANGIAEVLPLQPFPIRVMNTSVVKKPLQHNLS